MVLIVGGFLCFIGGVLSAAVAFAYAAHLAVAGVLAVFAGGLLRVYSE